MTSAATYGRGGGEAPVWYDSAACRTMDPAIFFSQDDDVQRAALTRCDGCTVKPECLRIAMETEQMHGIWGGMSERERRRLIRRRRREVRAA